MTSLIEKIVAIIAPHHCISCGNENNVLCEPCRMTEHAGMLAQCSICGAPRKDWSLCAGCQASSGLDHIWVGGKYDGLLAKLIHSYKFERVRAAHEPLGRILAAVLPFADWQVVAVPTAPKRVRQRGYDQAQLLARFLAAQRGLELSPALARNRDTRQVGATRAERLAQSTQMFSTTRKTNVRGVKVLLVDDVCTTGATLSAAAQLLRVAGAAQVDAVVAAWQPPKQSNERG